MGLALVTAACSTSTNTHAAPGKSHASTIAAAQAATLQAGPASTCASCGKTTSPGPAVHHRGGGRLSGTDATAGRLLQNQTDIGDALKPLYGDAAGAQLTALLREHILTAGTLIAAAKAGNTAKVTSTS
jgi:hypothetical protein